MITKGKKQLLIIPCSKRKNKTKKLIPAIERYDGPYYRVIRKAIKEGKFPKKLDVFIVSSKFGLLSPKEQIPYYDKKMNKEIANRLNKKIIGKIKNMLNIKLYEKIFVCLGKDYLESVNGLEKINKKTYFINGGIGEKTAKIRELLLG